MVELLLRVGMNVARFNFSLGSQAYHQETLDNLYAAMQRTDILCTVMLDTKVYYKFSNLSLLREPMMLIMGFFLLFTACIVYMHTDMSISKSSASYMTKLQWDEVQATVQHVRNIIRRCLAVHYKIFFEVPQPARVGRVGRTRTSKQFMVRWRHHYETSLELEMSNHAKWLEKQLMDNRKNWPNN